MKKFLLLSGLMLGMTSVFAGVTPNLIKMDSPSSHALNISQIQDIKMPEKKMEFSENQFHTNSGKIEFDYPVLSKQIEHKDIATRGDEDAFCEIIGTIFNENSDLQPVFMEKQEDGTYCLKPGITYAGNFYIFYKPGEGEGSQYLYNPINITTLGEPIKCSNRGYSFQLYKGEYTFVFNPEELTVTVSGEILPPDYYLNGSFNNYVLGDTNYKFTQSSENEAIYKLSWDGVLTSGFAVNTGSWLQYWATDNKDSILELDKPYQTTSMGEWYISLPEGLEVKNPSLSFNIETGLLTVDGTYQKPEYGYQLYTNIYGQENYYWSMTDEGDGICVLDNNLHAEEGWFNIVRYNKATNIIDQWFYREDGSGYVALDETLNCSNSGGAFYVHPGNYKFTFNSEELTLTVTGEMDPPNYYFYNSVRKESFKMEESEEGSGIYYANTEFIPSGYYIFTNYDDRYGSNGEVLIPGQAYSTVSGDNIIYTEDNLNIIDATVMFDSNTGELTITGDTSVPNVSYAISGTIFNEEDGWYFIIMDQENNGLYTYSRSSETFDGYFIMMEYDVTLRQYYKYLGPVYDHMQVEPNQAYTVSQNSNWFDLNAGSYRFTFDSDSQTLIVTKEAEELADLYISQASYPIIYPNGAYINYNILPITAPTATSYTVYMKPVEESDYLSIQTDTKYFTLEVNDLKPQTSYKFNIYTDCEIDGKTYTSPISTLDLTTSSIFWNYSLRNYSCTDTELTFEYNVNSNVLADTQIYMNYAIVEGSSEPDSETADTAEYTKVSLEDLTGMYKIQGLKPETEYIVYVYFSIESEGESFNSHIAYIQLTTSSAGIESLIDDDPQSVYYNLNGLRVNNPSHGLFIEVKGNKSRKIYLK